MKIPMEKEAWLALGKTWGWTCAIVALLIVILMQGLTLRATMQSWNQLTERVLSLMTMSGSQSRKKPVEEGKSGIRTIESTFFYHPQPNYTLSAIMGGIAVVNGKEVRVGDKIDKAVVEKVGIGSISIREDGADKAQEIVMHPGP
jgi:hypothetical protein